VKAEYLIDSVARIVGPTESMAFLDVGCGVGITDEFLVGRVGSVHGIDVAEGVLAKARAKYPDIEYSGYDGKSMPFEDNTFDVSFAMCVFHHVDPLHRQDLVAEMGRVTRKGGLVVIFEHNPWNLFTQFAVRRCALDDDAVLLKSDESQCLLKDAGFNIVEKRHILLTPWESRLIAKIERRLAGVAFGAQYYVMGQV